LRAEGRWWEGAVGYEVYLRSFADGDGDGVGDLPGLLERMDHLERLGVDIVWITPFYPSPMADHGYDVVDHTDVDPLFGTLDDLDAVVAEAHDRGLRVIIDLVPNHTSDEHPWFVAARSSRDDPYRERYIWRDPGPGGGPPNNWVSRFGGPAWTLDETTGQYYLHLFLPEQPDLNWAHPEVREGFEAILRFWLERGVDGFRVDVAHGLIKDPDLRDNPILERVTADADPTTVFESFDHVHDVDQPGLHDIYRRWRQIADEHGALLLGEVYLFDPAALARYVDDGLHATFCFSTLRVPWDAETIRNTLAEAVAAGGSRFAWPISSHDDPRAPTRFGGGEEGRERALAFAALLLGLPGMTFLYQGDELGLGDARLPARVVADPVAVRNPGVEGRDPMRTPIPWEPGPTMGFTDADEPWLPLGDRSVEDTVAHQAATPGSALQRVRALVGTRRAIPDLRGDVPVEWLDGDTGVVAYRRGSTIVAVRCAGTGPVALPAGGWRLIHSTQDGRESGVAFTSSFTLHRNEAVILGAR
jgi:alpha-glucosidase